MTESRHRITNLSPEKCLLLEQQLAAPTASDRGLEVLPSLSNHHTAFRKPTVEALARTLEACLRLAQVPAFAKHTRSHATSGD